MSTQRRPRAAFPLIETNDLTTRVTVDRIAASVAGIVPGIARRAGRARTARASCRAPVYREIPSLNDACPRRGCRRIATAADVVKDVVADCDRLGIRPVWMQRSSGGGSASEEAATVGRQAGMTVIAGGRPLMFDATADVSHSA